MNMLRSLALLLMILAPWASSHSEPVYAQGSAVVEAGNLALAREQAIAQALRQASWITGVRVESESVVENGQLQHDQIRLEGSFAASQLRIVDEQLQGDRLQIKIALDPTAERCPRRHHPALVMSQVTVRHSEDLVHGQLYDLPEWIREQLHEQLRQLGHTVYRASDRALPSVETYQPVDAEYTAQQQAITLAERHRVQWVLSGEIVSAAVVDPRSHQPRALLEPWIDRAVAIARLGPTPSPQRQLQLALTLRDGFSGAVVWQQQLSLQAPWQGKGAQRISAYSRQFAEGSFGHSLLATLPDWAAEVSEQSNCQPLMLQIAGFEGNKVLLEGGSRTGLRPGDQLLAYQRIERQDTRLNRYPSMRKLPVTLTITEVFPDLALAKPSEAMPLYRGDLAVIW